MDPQASSPLPESTGPDRAAFSARARAGTGWVVAGFGIGQALRLAANIALAALLFEEAFALMAIVAAVMQGLSMFSDLGLQPSVVQNRRGDEPDFLNTAWTLQVIRGAVLCLTAALLAWPLATLYGANDPMALELRWLIPLVALTALIDGVQSSRMLSAARQMQLGTVTRLELLVQICNAIVMVGLAWLTRSVYALAIAAVLAAGLRTFLSYWMLPNRAHRLMLDPASVREIFSFGKWIFLSTLLSFLALQIDRLVFAGLFPLAEVGVYSIAASLALMVSALIGTLQTKVIFPWYARMLDEGVGLDEAFRRTRAPVLVVSTYMATLLIVGATSFFELAYDHRYAQAGVFLPILAVGVWFGCLENMYGAAFLATGHSRWVAIGGAVKLVCFGLLLVPLIVWDWGLTGAAVVVVACEMVRAMVNQYLGRQLGLRNLRIESAMLFMLLLASGSGLLVVEHVPLVAIQHPSIRLLILGSLVTLLFSPVLVRVGLPILRYRAGKSDVDPASLSAPYP